MKPNKHCINCSATLKVIRNPNQHYCNHADCQKARKNRWRQKKRGNDPDYKSNQHTANKRWQTKNKDYWKRYRKHHPEYVVNNRHQQKLRDKMRREEALIDKERPLAKSDALSEKLIIKQGTYRLIPVEPYLAKSDALTAEIYLITKGCAPSAELAKRPPYSQT